MQDRRTPDRVGLGGIVGMIGLCSPSDVNTRYENT